MSTSEEGPISLPDEKETSAQWTELHTDRTTVLRPNDKLATLGQEQSSKSPRFKDIGKHPRDDGPHGVGIAETMHSRNNSKGHLHAD